MSRRVTVLDRLVAAVLGAVLVVGGLGTLCWSQGWFSARGRLAGRLVLSDTISLGRLPEIVRDGWWPWIAAVGGLGLFVLACGWLLGHLPAARVRRLTVLPRDGSSAGVPAAAPGQLTAETGPVTRAAAARLDRAVPGVATTSRIVHDRGSLVVELDVETDAECDPGALTRAIDTVVAELGAVTQDARLRARARVRVRRRVVIPAGTTPGTGTAADTPAPVR